MTAPDEKSYGMAFVVAAVASQLIALVLWGHITYLWVQGVEALAGAVTLAVFAARHRRDSRPARWPPLLPLAAIALTGGIKDLIVALDRPTPGWLVALLFASVIWLAVSSWLLWRAGQPRTPMGD